MKIRVFIAAVLLITTSSILVAEGQTKKGRGTQARSRKTKPITPPAAKSPAVTTPSGLTYVITRRSEGRQPRTGETVSVQYTGLLANGVKFDSSLDRGQPFSFKLGTGQVIKGWDEGIGKLRVGEQATLIIPPHLGYGVSRPGHPIPPNATLIFIVELIGVTEATASN